MKKSIMTIVLATIVLLSSGAYAKDKIKKVDLLREQLKTCQALSVAYENKQKLMQSQYATLQDAIKANTVRTKSLTAEIDKLTPKKKKSK